jgi:hypothetical protein
MKVDDSADVLLVIQGVYDSERQQACLRFLGCTGIDGIHLRFDETVYSRAFKVQTIENLLAAAGWARVISRASPILAMCSRSLRQRVS